MAWHQRQVIVSWRPTMELPDDHRGNPRPFRNIICTLSEQAVLHIEASVVSLSCEVVYGLIHFI